MSKFNKVPLIVAMLGLMILGAVLFVTTQLVFRDQPDVQNIFSIIWTVVLAILIYRLLLNGRSAKDPSRQLSLYGLLRFLMELIAVMTLLFMAIMAGVVLTSPGSNPQLAVVVGIMGILALLLLITPRVFQILNRRERSSRQQIDS